MNFPLVQASPYQVLLFIAPGAARRQMLAWIALQAGTGKVRVIDGGNQFNVYQVAKHIRRQTSGVYETLHNISVSRSFSCYQMTAMLEKTPPAATPLFILDFLFSYYDEDIRLRESQRLLQKALRTIYRISRHSTVVISTRPQMYSPDRSCLLDRLRETATQQWEIEGETPPVIHVPALPWPDEASKKEE